MGDLQTAEELGITPRTARQYIHRMMSGLGFHRRSELMLWALQEPGALTRDPVQPELHPIPCRCDNPFCAMMRQEKAA
jgi:hypothetical protein